MSKNLSLKSFQVSIPHLKHLQRQLLLRQWVRYLHKGTQLGLHQIIHLLQLLGTKPTLEEVKINTNYQRIIPLNCFQCGSGLLELLKIVEIFGGNLNFEKIIFTRKLKIVFSKKQFIFKKNGLAICMQKLRGVFKNIFNFLKSLVISRPRYNLNTSFKNTVLYVQY